ncbi:MAG TPA: Na(+)-translocating NADH-quinone reductase subunit C [Pseudomonadales bacterium]|nr:Na(+)-translocating NADH-quinone reductase subunit C [Pseudomonadales bacterium]
MAKDSIKQTLIVAGALCVVCALVVSSAAVSLKPQQQANQVTDRKTNILAAAGLLQEGVSIEEQFASVEVRVVDLRTGEFTEEVDPSAYDQVKAAKDPSLSTKLTVEEDTAKIFRREHFATVYLVKSGEAIDKLILPVRGYGLWGTLYGFVALESDANTVAGLGFYDHKETPGLGGEVDNPNWKALWPGKEIYVANEPVIQLVKGSVDPASPMASHSVDGLSGATLTSRGVTNLLQFWMSDMGYKPFLDKLRNGEV